MVCISGTKRAKQMLRLLLETSDLKLSNDRRFIFITIFVPELFAFKVS